MLRWVAAPSAAAFFSLIMSLGIASPALGLASTAVPEDALGFERTPPRLSFTDGEVSFFRPGTDGWAPARVNLPLAAGDELTAGERANLELQIGPRTYLRAGNHTELGFTSLEPDFLQFRLTRGTASLDVRSLRAGHTLEIDTPNASFTIERTGYYRIEVDESQTAFSSRRGGRAIATPASGESAEIAANEQLVVTGVEDATLATYPAPELDDWDRWNYARTDRKLETQSSRYVPEDVYGTEDLDAHGSWRVVADYGSVWVPRVAVGWAPYSVGSWAYDSYYGWSWVDDAPWGWAPFHYGRWVRVDGYWAWCPGPRAVRAYYAPALVAFYGSPSVSIGVGFGSSYWGSGYIGWVPLGWGEPLVPWWGPRGCRGNVRWAGWAGPRVVNNVVIHKKKIIHAKHVKHYSHARNHGKYDSIVAVDREHFGRKPVRGGKLAKHDTSKLRPVRDGELGVAPSPDGFAGTDRRSKLARQPGGERKVVARSPEGGRREGRAGRTEKEPSRRELSNAGRSGERSDARRAALSRSGQARSGQARSEQARPEQARPERTRSEQDRSRQARPSTQRPNRPTQQQKLAARPPSRGDGQVERRERAASPAAPPAAFQQERAANRTERMDRASRQSAPRAERAAGRERQARQQRPERRERAVASQPPRERKNERASQTVRTQPSRSRSVEPKQQAARQRSGRETGRSDGGQRGQRRGDSSRSR
jgi:hypothetical protein